MDGLSTKWAIPHPGAYILAVLGLALAVRALHALLRAIRLLHLSKDPKTTYWSAVWFSFKGIPPRGSAYAADYWYTFVLGCFEMAAYPVLIATKSWAVIGAWIGLKTIAHWSAWKVDRATFNLFLIGNILVFASAYACLTHMVKVG